MHRAGVRTDCNSAWLIEMNGGERPAHGDPSFGRPVTVVHGHWSKDVQIGGAGLC